MAGLALFLLIHWQVPPQHLPWTPLRIGDPVGLATRDKLTAIGDASCRAVLAEGGVRFAPRPDRDNGGFCRLRDTGVIEGGLTARLEPARPLLTCRQTLAVAIWDRQVVQPAARAELGRTVAAIRHYGTYACRTVYGRPGARPSQHATANAIDVAAFRFAGGGEASVLADFHGQTPEGRFLHRVRDGACRVFGHTLSPDYNRAHRNQLHLDMSSFTICA